MILLTFILSCGSSLFIACPVPLLALCYCSSCPIRSVLLLVLSHILSCSIARPVQLLVLSYYSSCPINRPSLIALPVLLNALSIACPVLYIDDLSLFCNSLPSLTVFQFLWSSWQYCLFLILSCYCSSSCPIFKTSSPTTVQRATAWSMRCAIHTGCGVSCYD